MTVAILATALGLFYVQQAVKDSRKREEEDRKSDEYLRKIESARIRILKSIDVSRSISPETK